MDIILGPPGTGKTTTLVDRVAAAVAAGTPLERVAFVSFTRRAAQEARERVCERLGVAAAAVPYFATLHAIAFRALKMTPREMFRDADYVEACAAAGVACSLPGSDGARMTGPLAALGDAALATRNLSAARNLDLRETWRTTAPQTLPWEVVAEVDAAVTRRKRDREALEFSDLIIRAGKAPALVDLFVVDEAQDLSLVQWSLARRLWAAAGTVLVAGDDDQALYDWAGGAAAGLIALATKYPPTVLPLSHRLPAAIHALAVVCANEIIGRVPKTFAPRGPGGSVEFDVPRETVDLTTGTWLLLARHRRGLVKLAALAREQGVAYEVHGVRSTAAPEVHAAVAYERLRAGKAAPVDATLDAIALVSRWVTPAWLAGPTCTWDELDAPWPRDAAPAWYDAFDVLAPDAREYVRALRRNGESLTAAPRVRIDTVHGAKGAEADNVLLVPEVTRAVWRALADGDPNEARVWYVAVTRARERLVLARPIGTAWTPPRI